MNDKDRLEFEIEAMLRAEEERGWPAIIAGCPPLPRLLTLTLTPVEEQHIQECRSCKALVNLHGLKPARKATLRIGSYKPRAAPIVKLLGAVAITALIAFVFLALRHVSEIGGHLHNSLFNASGL